MGKDTFSRAAYKESCKKFVLDEKAPTKVAELQAIKTGKLNVLVDPSANGVIRRSLPRFDEQGDLYELTIGVPLPVEISLDTTGSMGEMPKRALKELPDQHDAIQRVLQETYDLQLAIGIFGDRDDRFVLCRPEFEMIAERIVEQLTLMVPEGQGGDEPEDPHYGLFGSAYLTDRRINGYGLKGYHFLVTDAPARHILDVKQIKRIFGNEVFDIAARNGFQIDPYNLPDTKEVVRDLLKLTHAFVLQVPSAIEENRVEHNPRASKFWTEIYGPNRVVKLPNVDHLSQVIAMIIGLTEGKLNLQQVSKFLKEANVNDRDAEMITRSVNNIPIGAQTVFPNFNKLPKKGDLFRNKTDLWPVKKSSDSGNDGDDNDEEDEQYETSAEDGDNTIWL